jgi:hypothetical protein
VMIRIKSDHPIIPVVYSGALKIPYVESNPVQLSSKTM